MVRSIAIAACLFLLGCTSQPKYVEGTSLTLGAYIPWGGNLYGIELLSYVNGAVVKVPSNTLYQIEREHSSTNSWMWGMLETVEHTSTTVETK